MLTPDDQLFVDEQIEIKIYDESNNPIDGAELLAEGQKTNIKSSNVFFKFKITAEGTYRVHTNYNEVDSNGILLKVVDKNAVKGTGEFLLNGTMYRSEKAQTTFEGIFSVGNLVLSGWSEMIYAVDGTVAFFAYYTPTKDLGGGQYEAVLPNESNIMKVMAGVMSSTQDLLGQTNEPDALTVSYTISKVMSTKITGDFNSIDGEINGFLFKAKFTGDHYLITKAKLLDAKQGFGLEDLWQKRLDNFSKASLFKY
ncbi:hypothetical protein [Myroides pelagicus]|uniref:Uncharacterized protein n=1 Tax=Myroides pelagicus TaxID=270914 RepID=A0A7K1GPB0_9FLAO|nr:hypothetical protein [Myroides pelagicus]MEC4115035.1 hypothetical protein [Myroides pelagicus]MTH30735.1 hypothetical protein [Myroides pelagicus]